LLVSEILSESVTISEKGNRRSTASTGSCLFCHIDLLIS